MITITSLILAKILFKFMLIVPMGGGRFLLSRRRVSREFKLKAKAFCDRYSVM